MTATNRQPRIAGFARSFAVVIAASLSSYVVLAQSPEPTAPPAPAESQLVQQAQSIFIPVHAFSLADAGPVKDLQPTDVKLDVDGNVTAFQLSRPWDDSISPSTGQAEDQPNMLIILPAGGPLDRSTIVNEAVAALKTAPLAGWNISILDDSGSQIAYTHQLPLVISELEKIGVESPQPTSLADWRHSASVAIASMRELPGRRVVLSLGNLFHEIVFQGYNQVYNGFQVGDVATAARAAGVILYSTESTKEVDLLRQFPPPYSLVGSGPWMLVSDNNLLDGWICGTVAETLQQIRSDGMAAYNLDLHLALKQMDGLPHIVSISPNRTHLILNVPTFYMAPSLPQLQQLSLVSAPLREALKNPPANLNSPLQIGTQMEYFPHPDGKTGTQVISTGLFWTGTTSPPSPIELAQQIQQTTTGYKLATTVQHMDWYASEPIWNTSVEVPPGDYQLNVAAADATTKIIAGQSKVFSVDPADPNETVRISSLVIGRSCVFVPPPPGDTQASAPQPIDYLRAGDCSIQLEPSHSFSPRDVLWTLVRITPIGKMAQRPAKDWKGDFNLVDGRGSKLTKQPIHWLSAEDGSFVGTAAFQLGDPKLKLVDGEYALTISLKGPGIEEDYSEDAPFLIFGAGNGDDSAPSQDRR